MIALVRSTAKFRNRFEELSDSPLVQIIESTLDIPVDVGVQPVDFIIHAVSFASPQYYSQCPVEVLAPNTIGTFNLLNLAKEKKVKGFLMFSTGDIYEAVKDKKFVTEDDGGYFDTLDILNCYSESEKLTTFVTLLSL